VISQESGIIALAAGNSSEILDTSLHNALSVQIQTCTVQLQFALKGKLQMHRLQVGKLVDKGGTKTVCHRLPPVRTVPHL
jgi:hypothetical protein